MRTLGFVVMVMGLMGCPEHEPQVLLAQANIKLDSSCIAQAQVGSQAPTVQKGIIDLSMNRYGYVANIQLVNFLSQSQVVTELGPGDFHLENNIVLVGGVTVNYEIRGMDVDLPSGFFVSAPTSVYPGEAAIAAANVVPPSVLKMLRNDPWMGGPKKFDDPLLQDCYLAAGKPSGFTKVPLGGRRVELLVKMTFEGTLMDGTQVYSNELRFPVEVCNGCLLSTQIDSGQFIQATAEGDTSAFACESPPCVAGQDMCTSYERCFAENFYVDEAAESVLATCASDELVETFPPESAAPYLEHPTAGVYIGEYNKANSFSVRLNHLRFRYAFEKVNTQCLLLDEAPLWPPPQ